MVIGNKIGNSVLIKSIIRYFFAFLALSKSYYFKFAYGKKGNNDVLAICLHRIGDTVFTLPSIKYLYDKFGNNLIVMCYEGNSIIYKKFVSDNIRLFAINNNDLYWEKRLVKFSALKNINPRYFHAIFDFTGGINAASVLMTLHGKNIFGMHENYFQSFYTSFINKNTTNHLTEMYFDIIKIFDKDALISKFRDYPIKKSKGLNIVINPFGGWAAKEWNFDKYIQLGKILSKNYKVSFNLDKVRGTDKIIEEINTAGFSIVISETIEDLINKLEQFSFFIGNDSGPLYIASMLGIPTFSIYGPTNPSYSIPLARHHDFIQKKISCSPKENEQYCHTFGGQVGCPKFECMNLLNVEEVYKSIENFLKTINFSDL